MSQANKQLALQALRLLAGGDPDEYAQLHHPDYVNHEAAAGRQRGREGARATAVFLNSVFDDLHHEPLDVIAERDLVVVRARASGRQVGEIDGFAASGRPFSVQHIHIFRVTDAKIIEHWACRDDLGAARQIGAIPERGRSSVVGRLAARRHRRRASPASSAPQLLSAVAGPWMCWFGMPFPLPGAASEEGNR
jgi:predicted ester cyclase